MTTPGLLLWGVLPYLTLVLLIGGTIWRHKYDKFGWTTRSSQLLESKWLRLASPVFHYGILGVIAGHLIGLVLPERWTTNVHINEHAYHLVALILGVPAGVAAIGGLALLIVRRRSTRTVLLATTPNDKAMYVLLFGALALGLSSTLWNIGTPVYDYREGVSLWFRGLFSLHPEVELMQAAPVIFRIHVTVGMVLIAAFPFTRLVHAFSAPVPYLFRPYIVYRARDPKRLSTRPARPGWE
ncbi:respiratory nitrate reductase subunit gamma [Actinospica durhamensis]|uniref:Nitrate reductase-like protein NarX n=1 Tax=Actinospica durhamensis TaxID=1508375 RepID=A0A941EZH9_9ACTN|nr:respiratory nitrate reductase subunit gamma [Actinospica durhamensis]MBR7838089.1 respiratory nitrate reductase subunit gamma [Actinospica durhamensis]